MRSISRTLSITLALAFAAGTMAPLPASAFSLARGKQQINVHIANKSDEAQSIKVDGRVYTVKPHQSMEVKVPVGSVVYAAGNSTYHQDGDKLITVTPQLKDGTINLEAKTGA
ncbi:MAG TPA: hypothetical protein VG714_00155 [Acidobacteriaceae bacterium]|nr:hypothetical protein [Acidobacteriaceae bacterium]